MKTKTQETAKILAIRARIAAQIERLDAELATVTMAELKEAEQASARLCKLLERISEVTPGSDEAKEFMAFYGDGPNAKLIELNNRVHERRELSKTLASPLMEVHTRYLVTNQELISPAGIHPDEEVYLQCTIAIHTDDLKRPFPLTTPPLQAYDLSIERARRAEREIAS